jgi:ubiquinone/menaquinone biosynthesis C-methylase UbiE
MTDTLLALFTVISMTRIRGRYARVTVKAAALRPDDRVADIGCGPGTAVRMAALRMAALRMAALRMAAPRVAAPRVAALSPPAGGGAVATGVDPSPLMLGLARRISALRRTRRVSFLAGSAEKLPLASGSVTVVWAIASFHHWSDRAAGLAEVSRVLAPGGRVLLVERLIAPDARGRAAHGLSRPAGEQLMALMTEAGFSGVRAESRRTAGRDMIIYSGMNGRVRSGQAEN